MHLGRFSNTYFPNYSDDIVLKLQKRFNVVLNICSHSSGFIDIYKQIQEIRNISNRYGKYIYWYIIYDPRKPIESIKIINKYKDKVDLFFLFANETVLDFYPKFGFRSVQEFIFIRDMDIPEPNYSERKLNIENSEDYALLKELINHRQILTNKFGAENYGFITMWHVLNLYLDSMYYINDEDVIIIKKEKNDQTSQATNVPTNSLTAAPKGVNPADTVDMSKAPRAPPILPASITELVLKYAPIPPTTKAVVR